MSKTVCIYHGNCADGFTAAWVVQKWWYERSGNSELDNTIDFIAGVYQTPPPLEQVKDADVIIVDFSYKRAVMEQIAAAASSAIWIDHHKTAIEDMEGFTRGNFIRYLDFDRSGAGLTWDYFFPGQPRPRLVNTVEDRDLWKFLIPATRELQAYIFSYEYSFDKWDELERQFADGNQYNMLVAAGSAIERKHFKDIRELLPICTRNISIAGVIIPCANLPYTMVSDAGNIMAKQNPTLFGICYYDGMSGRNFSLRSIDGGVDVSEIAKQYGGGGHKHAAGFRVSFEKAREFEIP
jgi:oligoribonuclease NrnB/cAMP/cGMP phosphodiesterase (DHH superfamily)